MATMAEMSPLSNNNQFGNSSNDNSSELLDLFNSLDSNTSYSNHSHSQSGMSDTEGNDLNSIPQGINSGGEGDYNFDPGMLAYLASTQQHQNLSGTNLGQLKKYQENNNSNDSYDQSNQAGFESYTTGNNGASSSSGLSNASSPYSFTGPGSNFDHIGASPPFAMIHDSSGTIPGGLPVFSATSYSQYTDSPYSHNQTSKAPLGQTPTYTNFVAQPSSFSPTSTTSPNSNHSNGGGTNPNAHNAALARMIAEAQSRQIQIPTLPMTQQLQPQQHQQQHQQLQQQTQPLAFAPSLNPSALSNDYQTSFYPPSLSYSSDSTGNSSARGFFDDQEVAKKRKLGSTDSDLSRTSFPSQGSQIASGSQAGFSSTIQMRRQEGANYPLKSSTSSVIPSAPITINSVNLIANAGIQSTRENKIYRDDSSSSKVPSVLKSAKITATSIKLSTAANAKALKAAEKKAAASKKGTEKKKKGDKGHNAVERRYRNNINNAIATLRDIVPALRHLKPLPSMPASRRRASQFTLSTAAQAPTPAGLIDGIPAAKTLSKGTILGKSIEYIQYLQGAREDAAEDIEIFKAVVNEMVTGGSTLVDMYEQRRAIREIEREQNRDAQRKEQALMDEDDSDEEEDDEKSNEVKNEYNSDQDGEVEAEQSGQYQYQQQQQQQQQQQFQQQQQQELRQKPTHVDGLAQLRRNLGSAGATLPYSNQFENFMPSGNAFPPSPASSSEGTSLSPRMMLAQQQQQQQQQYRGHISGPPRMLLASFMGLSFAGGIGYDWTYGMAEEAGDNLGVKVWGGRFDVGAASSIPAPSSIISSGFVHPALHTGLLFLAVASVIASAIFLLYPLMDKSSSKSLTFDESKNRSVFRMARRADALASLADLTISNSTTQTYASECKSALAARKELLKLVGAPTYGLLPALIKEALATALRNIANIRVGSFSTWSQEERVEAAVAWVRIAEIEATVGVDQVHYLARCYTFLRLFNLSRSPYWPSSTSSTSRASVNAVLAIHLNGLGQSRSAHALWNQASTADRKKLDAPLDSWVEIATSTDFERVRSILAIPRKLTDPASPSDTVPLMRISEVRCEAALRETWAHLFTAVVQTTCPPHSPRSTRSNFATLVNLPLLLETIEHVLASTAEGTSVHSLAKVTRALCAFYTGEEGGVAKKMSLELAHEARSAGPVARLACASAFFTLLLDDADFIDPIEPRSETDTLATTTLGWLVVRRHSSEALANREGRKADPRLHATTLGIRRLFGAKVFYDESLDLEESVDLIGEALTEVTRRAAGLAV